MYVRETYSVSSLLLHCMSIGPIEHAVFDLSYIFSFLLFHCCLTVYALYLHSLRIKIIILSNVQAGDHGPSMPERPGTSVRRNSLRPNVQPKTSPLRWAKSTARTTTSPTQRAFAIAGPSAWNSLPDLVRNPNSIEAAFRRLLKTF